MSSDIIAEVTLTDIGSLGGKPSPAASFGFLMSFGDEGFSSAIVESLSKPELNIGEPTRIHLKFLVPEAALKVAKVGAKFTFFDQSRKGTGQVVEVCGA